MPGVALALLAGNSAQQRTKQTMAKTDTNSAQTQTQAAPAKGAKIDVGALLARIGDLTAETLNHPQVVNKTEAGVASRVARILNREKTFPCEAHRFWTGAHVLAYSAKNS